MIKSRKIFALTLIASLIVVAALNASAINVNAQSQATVTMLESVGGTTNPTVGTTTYPDGTQVTFTATPIDGFTFANWVVSTTQGSSMFADNPVTIPVTGGETYTVQAVFSAILSVPNAILPANYTTAAIVVILSAAGGTTNPPPGTYAMDNATSFDLTATPSSGWEFVHWVIGGPNLSHGGYPFTATPTDNPYNVNHGYGSTFSYQPVFTPVGTTEPTPTVPEFSSVATIVLALALVAIAFGTYAYRLKNK